MRDAIITSSVLILCIVLLRRLCRGKISAGMQYMLWLIVAARLVMPAITTLLPNLLPEAEFSVMNAADRVEGAAQDYIQQIETPIQLNFRFPIGALPMLTETNADGPTAVFLAGSLSGGFSWIDFFRPIWYAGMAAAGCWMVIVNILFVRKLRKSRVRYEKEDFKLPIYLVKGLDSPCLYGLPGKQAVYLPEDVAGDEEKIRHILAHEYCHYKHRDVFWSALRCILLVVYWFHPLVWLAAVLSRQDCELACDEASIRILGEEERIAYGKTLLALITRKTKASDMMCAATTMSGGAKGVRERIRRIAEKPHKLAIVLLPLIVAVGVLVAFTFTQAKDGSQDAHFFEGEESLVVATECFQMTFPEAFLGNAYYRVENDTDVIIYQKDSDQEIGRFCKVPYGEAVRLADEKEVTLIGVYGANLELLLYQRHGAIQETEPGEEHFYTPGDSEDVTGTDSNNEGVPGTDSNSGSVPGTDSNDDDTTYFLPEEDIQKGETAAESSGGFEPIPAPENVESEVILLPYEEDSNYNAQAVSGEEDGNSKDYLPNENIAEIGTPGQSNSETQHEYYASENENGNNGADNTEVDREEDDTTYILPEESITSMAIGEAEAVEGTVHYEPDVSVYLPEEVEEKYCYLYIPADYTGADADVQDRLVEMNQLLIELADSTTVLYMSKESVEEKLDSLRENRTASMSDTARLSVMANSLLPVQGLHYGSLEIKTFMKPEEVSPVTLHYRIEAGDYGQVDEDVLFMNAVLLFASVENLQQCNMRMTDIKIYFPDSDETGNTLDTEKISQKEISFEREQMEELFGPLYPCSATKEDFTDLYNRALEYLQTKSS
ncbi:MAG: M56 family metallopeptidase [Blautia sp.]|nr:M56 family metallopeptidase [Lachnoclostridium sp.]MCM1211920.1 M56 family metallopeptidase [Blautia sp.]